MLAEVLECAVGEFLTPFADWSCMLWCGGDLSLPLTPESVMAGVDSDRETLLFSLRDLFASIRLINVFSTSLDQLSFSTLLQNGDN